MQERVLIVDDDKFVQSVLTKALRDEYELRSAFSGEEGLVAAREWMPKAILLDVEMPNQNGYEVCDQLKRDNTTKHIPIIFLSSKSSTRERLLGYEVGGDDYLVKPCSNEELRIKIKLHTQHSSNLEDLEVSAQAAQATAMEAMATSFELGKALRFVESSYAAVDIDTLAESLLSFCRDLNLSSVLMVLTRLGKRFYSTNTKAVSPLESDVLKMLHAGNRIEDFGCRTQINYPQVAILVKNMPLDDMARYGRIKDALPFVLGAADAKVRILDAERALTMQTAELSASVEAVKLTLDEMRESFGGNLMAVSSIMSELNATIAFDLRKMGLDLDQEEWICDKVEVASKSIYSCLDEKDSQEQILAQVVELLEKLTSDQNRIIEENLNNQPKVDLDTGNDVELF